MNNEERWDNNYNHILHFINTQKCLPSKHRKEDHSMLNWLKFNKRRLAQDSMPENRRQRFIDLLEKMSKYKRLNQYSYVLQSSNQLKIDL